MAIVSGFIGAEDPDSWCVVQRTDILADTAADTLFGIHPRLLDDAFLSTPNLDFHRDAVNGLVRNWTMFLTDHAVSAVGIRDATCRIKGCQADFDLVFLLLQQRPNGFRGTDMPAQRAGIVAVANQRNEMGSENPF